MYCEKCGFRNEEGATHCAKCQERLTEMGDSSTRQKAKLPFKPTHLYALIGAALVLVLAVVLVFVLRGRKAEPIPTPATPVVTQPVPTEAEIPTEANVPTVNTTVYETYYVVNCEESTPLYVTADIGSTQLCRIPLGAAVSYIQSAENGFCNVAYMGSTGYVLATCLSSQPPQAQTYEIYYVVNCSEYITLRSAPSTDATALCKIPFGESVSFLDVADNGFYKISYMGSTGYALASYLSQTPQSQPKPKEDPIALNTTFYVVKCNQAITLRTSDSTSARAQLLIRLGEAVSYLGTASNGFYKVSYFGQTGYVLSSYLSTTPPAGGIYSQPITLQVVNCKESITLRATDSTSAAEICQIPLGSFVEYLGYGENGFYVISYNGTIGYALSDYLV